MEDWGSRGGEQIEDFGFAECGLGIFANLASICMRATRSKAMWGLIALQAASRENVQPSFAEGSAGRLFDVHNFQGRSLTTSNVQRPTLNEEVTRQPLSTFSIIPGSPCVETTSCD